MEGQETEEKEQMSRGVFMIEWDPHHWITYWLGYAHGRCDWAMSDEILRLSHERVRYYL